ncbi:hypothetical protein PI124_g16965 [Phytophthora idaei]|nr:hypothetical protein PI125_g17252 [Phytophthora idaei]KAG3139800.1 hypothetical protein PI126_g16304 [Phytophthora idaei]KAG3238065.1 hypothetical protein PI124_g16965 [Phytophthora idaei]
MVKLFCAIIGEAGSPFSAEVPIDEGKTVDVLKKAIKNETHQLKDVEVMHMQLFLAKKKRKKPAKKKSQEKEKVGGGWLDEDEAAAVSRDELGRPQCFEQMKTTLYLTNDNTSCEFSTG